MKIDEEQQLDQQLEGLLLWALRLSGPPCPVRVLILTWARHTKATVGMTWKKKEGQDGETLTAIPQAGREAAPVCGSALLR